MFWMQKMGLSLQNIVQLYIYRKVQMTWLGIQPKVIAFSVGCAELLAVGSSSGTIMNRDNKQ